MQTYLAGPLRFPAYIILKGMWIFWPLKWCFGAKRQAVNANKHTGAVVIVVDTHANVESDLRQQLRANDALNQQYEARLPEEVSTPTLRSMYMRRP